MPSSKGISKTRRTCAAPARWRSGVELDAVFHTQFVEFLGNHEIVRTFGLLRDRMQRVVTRVFQINPLRIDASHNEHVAIAEAVIKGQGATAAELIVAHLEARQATDPLAPRLAVPACTTWFQAPASMQAGVGGGSMWEVTTQNAGQYLREVRGTHIAEPLMVRELAGGVSNIVLLVTPAAGEPFVLKQARGRLRVAQEWLCPVERIWREVEVLRICGGTAIADCGFRIAD